MARVAIAALALSACAHSHARTAAPEPEAVELSLPRLDGSVFDLRDLRGQPALIWFFTTWSVPSQAEAHRVAALARDLDGRAAVVGIALDLDGATLVRPYAELLGLRFPILLADDDVRAGDSPLGKTVALPRALLLDRRGRVRAELDGLPRNDVLIEAIEKLANEPR